MAEETLGKSAVSWLVVVLLLLLEVKARGCPARCQCDLVHVPRTVNCAGLGLQAFPENISDVVEHLDLSGNLLTELPAEVNRLTELQHLNLARNKLSSLPANLRGLGNLRKLDLSENALKDPQPDLAGITHLARLKTLYLAGNPLTELDGLKNAALQFLSADSCGIERLKNTSLSGLPELTKLSLSGNPLKDIKDPYSLKLKGLDLSKCQLKVLSPRAFQGFPELIDLRLAENPTLVYSTRYETLRHQKLQKIDVSRCDLDRPGLHGFPSLTYARLSSNSIRMLPDRIFAKNRELTHLFLDYNHLERLNRSTFANLLRLQVLDLSANGLKAVPSMAFRDNIELQFLNLSDNYMVDFPKLSTSVISLDLSANLISRVDPNSLSGTPSLYHLNLSKNLIDEMPSGLDSGTLRNLILRRNRITSLENVSLSGLPELEKLDLSGNMLTKGVTPEIFFDNPNLRHLYLHDNPWICDCTQLYPGYMFLTSLAAKTETLICHSPKNVTGFSWKLACANEWKREILHKSNNKTWGLILVSLLTVVVLTGTIISIRHSMKLKRQSRNQRLEVERAEVRERLRLLQRRFVPSQRLQEELREVASEPRIHPMELIGPPSYEEAVTMPRLARSLDALDTVTTNSRSTTVIRMTGSSESLRAGKKRCRPRRLRSQSEDNLTRREMRRQERLRRARETGPTAGQNDNVDNRQEDDPDDKEGRSRNRPPTPTAAKRKSIRRMSTRNGTSTDDEDSEGGGEAGGRRIGRTVIRHLDREPRSGYRPSTDGDS
ncbi:chondroadherin-like protein isoform X1 [Nasonia vitripennis]|uniref:Uncharacterized protein n=1 Tax=Nasonia vitripennis TaxID=7425 RepID=A0A7M7HHK3_NASVI|nr:chondroadherin-like protein isoform X1 [Nasonia vitripennis]